MKTTQYLKLEKRIAVGERGGVLDRWRYGRALLDAKAGRKQLPHGMIGFGAPKPTTPRPKSVTL